MTLGLDLGFYFCFDLGFVKVRASSGLSGSSGIHPVNDSIGVPRVLSPLFFSKSSCSANRPLSLFFALCLCLLALEFFIAAYRRRTWQITLPCPEWSP